MSDKLFAVVYFEIDNTYVVIPEAKKLKNQKKAKVFDRETNKWYTGDIVYRGNNKLCQKYIDFKLSNATFMPTDDDATEVEAVQDEVANRADKNSSN